MSLSSKRIMMMARHEMIELNQKRQNLTALMSNISHGENLLQRLNQLVTSQITPSEGPISVADLRTKHNIARQLMNELENCRNRLEIQQKEAVQAKMEMIQKEYRKRHRENAARVARSQEMKERQEHTEKLIPQIRRL